MQHPTTPGQSTHNSDGKMVPSHTVAVEGMRTPALSGFEVPRHDLAMT